MPTIPPLPTPPRWVRTKEVAYVVDVDNREVRRWAEAGLIESRRTPGGHWRVAVDDDGWPLERPDDEPRRKSSG